MWGAIIGGIVALASALISSSSSKKQASSINRTNIALQEKANQNNLELSKYQFDQNKAMWEAQNQYNTPSSQMMRYGEAGLNPNLIYGQGSSGNATNAPSFEAPRFGAAQIGARFTPFQIPEVLGMYQDYQLKQEQIASVQAQNALTVEKTRSEAVNRMVSSITGRRKEFDLDLASELRKYTVEGAAASTGTKAQQLKLLMEYGARERELGLGGRALANQLAKVNVASMSEKLELLKQFGWSEGYQRSVLNQKNIDAVGLENFFREYKNDFTKVGISTSDNFIVRLLFQMMKGAGVTPGSFAR